ncbi:bifunctional heparan sulfate N-deacetylase/N-sulfotransferase 3-like isoform X1 [Haliotis rufescens]|uniref:bifunctional heparan sulfate N-deacetylase/N-sulfotransferase 3-like isoform X1 n=1 Tax=Haliotis rufescens TaxID=6454 RepID=UPI00201F26E3|nr:bifunctional heparan sulfate N-deacetylase/N-sulfotransferase 3-like isoform X1 [Haliotis rufescens]
MWFSREIRWCRTSVKQCLCLKRFSLMKGLAFVISLSVLSSVFFAYHLMNFGIVKRHADPPKPLTMCRPDSTLPKNVPHVPKDHSSEASLRLGTRVLLMVETQYSKQGIIISRLLEGLRIEYKIEPTGKNLPTLTHADKGKFAVVIFENYEAYVNMDNWNRQLLDKYCRDYNVGMIGFFPSKDGTIIEEVMGFPLSVQNNLVLQDYKLNHYSDIWRITKPGDVFEGRLQTDYWTVFHTNHTTYEPLSFARVSSDNGEISRTAKSVVPVVYDAGFHDGIRRILYGYGLGFWLHHLMMIDSLSFISHGKLSVGLDRFIQIDIDDIFVGKEGIRMKVEDVVALAETQSRLAKEIDGFHFNLGFSGRYYMHGTAEEDLGDKKLIEYRDKFWWFGHMWRHEQAHKFDQEFLERSMLMNFQFAKENDIHVKFQYAVAPHHSGVYPVHDALYHAWHNVWDIKVTSTEEYPRLYPYWRRRGFIHKGIMVLPRQTCGLFTHTIFMSDYNGGKEELDKNIQGGELFQTFLYSPVSIFMTHLSNYGNDRLALYTFESVVRFIKCWTNLRLRSLPPLQLGLKYFEMFPEERDPIWQNPCDYKRHLLIWSANKTCSRMPKFLVIGPQKTGTTALYTFLGMHPSILSNYNSPETYEEIQFFNGNNYYKGIDWYMEFFPVPVNSTSMFMFEKSATYFDRDLVPMRAHALLPRAKIICILLSPSKRAYSWYQHMRAHEDPTALNYSFHEIITATEMAPRRVRELRSRCLNPGTYAQHLMRWLDYFSPRQATIIRSDSNATVSTENLFIIDGEQLRNDPIHVMHHIQRFLHIDTYFDYSQHLRYDPRKGFFCQVLSDEKNKCLGKGKGRNYPPMEDKSDRILKRYYRKHNIALSKLLHKLNMVVPDWLEEDLRYP